MSNPFDQFHADYVARQYRSERHAALDAYGASEPPIPSIVIRWVAPCKPCELPSEQFWFLAGLSIAFIFVGVCAAFASGVL